jgi:putative heme-binding domain-containing protein
MDISLPEASATQGRILCLHADGHLTVFADHLYAVFGMQYLDGKLYVMHNPKFSMFTDDNGVGKDRLDLIESTNPQPWALNWNDHVPANFRLAMDGYFYVAVGDKGLYHCTGRDGKQIDMHGGGIFRLRPDGTELEVYCTGVRNILDIAMNEEDEIFTYDNTDEHDWMGRFTHMVDGGFYGYPHDFVPRRPYTLWMMADYGGGAATGALCYTEDALPQEYRGRCFLADFGKRQILNVAVEREGGSYKAVSRADLFSEMPPDFRPVGICLSPDGLGFYICDWQHADTKENISVGRLLKLSYTGKSQAAAKPKWYAAAAMGRPFTASTQELVGALSHPSREVRLVAQRRLAERGRPAVAPLSELLRDASSPPQARWHAMWALDAIDGGLSARDAIFALTGDREPSLRRQALRQIGTRRIADAAEIALARLRDADGSVRFWAATALGRISQPAAVPALMKALSDVDPTARYATFHALNRIGRAEPSTWSEIAKGLESDERAAREGTAFAMRETFDPALVQVLARIASDRAKPAPARESALQLLGTLERQYPTWKGEWGAYHPALAPPPEKTMPWEGTATALAALTGALDEPDPVLRRAAAEALRFAKDSAAAAKLRVQFEKENEIAVRISIAAALGAVKDAASARLVGRVLDDQKSDPGLVRSAVVAAGQIATQDLVRPLRQHVLDASSEIASAAVEALSNIAGDEATSAIIAASDDPRYEVRRLALSTLGTRQNKTAVPALLKALRDDETRSVAIAALAKLPDARALDAYLDALDGKDAALRDDVRKAISSLGEETLPSIEAKSVQLSPRVLAELRRVFDKSERARKGALFAAIAKVLEPADYEQFARKATGNPDVGRKLFMDEKGLACTRCHALGGKGGTIAPDLANTGSQFPRDYLIDSILYPSKSVREGYELYVVETKDGQSLDGLLKGQTTDQLLLLDSGGVLHRIPMANVKRRRSSSISMMPEGLQTGLSLQEFADLIAFLQTLKTDSGPPPGFTAVFNGKDLSGFKIAGGAAEHWHVSNGVLEHDGIADDLWTEQKLGDFILQLEWRWPDKPVWEDFPVIGVDGYEVKDADGKTVTKRVLDAGDSGVFLRGYRKAQANLFCYPCGSGEVWEYRTDPKMPEDVRRAVTPKKQADKPLGEWNAMTITMKGDRLTVVLNGEEVISSARLPGVPAEGPIGFQHEHGRIQFRNIYVKEIHR